MLTSASAKRGEVDIPRLELCASVVECVDSSCANKDSSALARGDEGFLLALGYSTQRGYGRTTGWSADFDADQIGFRFINLLRDAIGVLYAMGHRTAEAAVGHDFGSSVASYASLVRPDIFKRMVLMSAPFAGPPQWPAAGAAVPDIDAELAALARPRKHYQQHYRTPGANAEMWHCPQGVHAFLRARLADHIGAEAAKVRLLYGGSVKSSNAAEIFALPHVDGALVGGASLKAADFAPIVAALSAA